ncbi:MAG: S24/S26 family peptidase [Prevotella sp.]|jgi:SOS-response transcriptional repressor LexA|nr:S24/S26 family peptidase [Prevotella sp.]
MQKTVSNNVAIAAVADFIKEGRHVILPVKGFSMHPFIIGGKESVELVPPRQAQVGDVVLAWVDGCRYVVHRVISIAPDGKITLMGDGNIIGTEQCTQKDIVATAINVIAPNGKKRPLPNDSNSWKLWNKLKPVRRWLLAVYRRVWL